MVGRGANYGGSGFVVFIVRADAAVNVLLLAVIHVMLYGADLPALRRLLCSSIVWFRAAAGWSVCSMTLHDIAAASDGDPDHESWW